MKITQLTPGTGSFYCGSCLRDHALCRRLEALGADVFLVPLYLPFLLEDREPDDPRAVRMGGINLYLAHRMPWTRGLPGWLHRLLDRSGLLVLASRLGNMTDAAGLGDMTVAMLRGEEPGIRGETDRFLDWLAVQERPDVVCLSNAMLLGIAPRLKETLRRPLICTLQGEAPFLDALPATHREQAWAALGDRLRSVDAFIAVSHDYGERMRQRLGIPADRIRVIHNGIEVEEFARPRGGGSRSRGDLRIGYLARMCRDKGIHTLVEAYCRLRQRGSVPGVRLEVAGVVLREDHRLLAELRRRLRAAGYEADARFRENVSREEKVALLHSLDVFSVPATYGESFGLYVLEALAAGVSVVQPRHAAFPELLEATGGGVLCEPDDPEDLAGKLEELLLDEARREALAEQGRRRVHEHFTTERMAREVLEVCKMVSSG
jgi:glycosyltransferase involved in cell wall biosynthesis